MMGTDPDLQTIFHIYALMSLCFDHIRLYFEMINRHTADYRLLIVRCEVLFMTNYVICYKRMMPHCFLAFGVQGNRILRKELNIAQQQKKQTEMRGGNEIKTFRMERVAAVKVMLVCMRC